MKRCLVTDGRVMNRDHDGTLFVGYRGDEILLPDAVYDRHKGQLEILEDGLPDPKPVAVKKETLSARQRARTGQRPPAVSAKQLRDRIEARVQERKNYKDERAARVKANTSEGHVKKRIAEQAEKRRLAREHASRRPSLNPNALAQAQLPAGPLAGGA
jgi:hypothetical protein